MNTSGIPKLTLSLHSVDAAGKPGIADKDARATIDLSLDRPKFPSLRAEKRKIILLTLSRSRVSRLFAGYRDAKGVANY